MPRGRTIMSHVDRARYPEHRSRTVVRRGFRGARPHGRADHGGRGKRRFFCARGLTADLPIDAASRAELLRLFRLEPSAIRPLWRQKFEPSHPNRYRGWFPLQTGFLTAKEGIDLGADVAYGSSVVEAEDPLREATPLPPEDVLPAGEIQSRITILAWKASADADAIHRARLGAG
jgi:hypothetical protein